MSKEARIVVIGKTSSGKTAFLNNLLQQKLFKEHNDLKVNVNEGYWFNDKSKGKVVAIDSPGAFIDRNIKATSDEVGNLFMIDFLKQVVEGIDCLFLVLDINNLVFDSQFTSVYGMLEIIFSSKIRYHTAFVFTHCDPETREKWEPIKEDIIKTWNKKNLLNEAEPVIDFPLIFTSMKTTEGLEKVPEIVSKMGRYEDDMTKQLRDIKHDKTKTNEDFENVINEKLNKTIEGDLCTIL